MPVGDHEQLFSVKPDGSGARQLTDFPDSGAWDGAWSPDSTKIAFVRAGPNKASSRDERRRADSASSIASCTARGVASRWEAPPGIEEAALDDRDAERRRTFAGMPGAGDSPCVFADSKHVAFQASFGRTDGKEAIMVAEIDGGPKGAADHALAAYGGQDRLLARRHEDRLQRTAVRAAALVERLRRQRRWQRAAAAERAAAAGR